MDINFKDLSKHIRSVKEEVFLLMWNNNIFLSLDEMRKVNVILTEVEATCDSIQ
jgi:hypothetical protein